MKPTVFKLWTLEATLVALLKTTEEKAHKGTEAYFFCMLCQQLDARQMFTDNVRILALYYLFAQKYPKPNYGSQEAD